MKKIIVNILKILVVLGLIFYVLSNVQWRDNVTYLTAGGDVERIMEGRIIGNWDSPSVQFLPQNSLDPIYVQREIDNAKIAPGIFTYFKNLDVHYFVLGVIFILVSLLFSATRWWWLLRANDLKVSLFDSVRYTWLGLFFNNVIPGQTGGDVIKAIYIARRCSSDRVPAFLSVFVDRILGLTSLALLAAIVVAFYAERFFEIAVAIWSFLLLGVVLACAAFSRRLREKIGLKRMLLKLPVKVQELLKEVDSAIFHYRKHKTGVAVWLGLGIINHIVSVSAVVMFGYAVGVGIPTHEYFVLVPVIIIVSAIPIAPNGWGIGEALYAKLFGDYGAVYLAGTPNAQLIMSTRGIAVSIVYRLVTTALSLLGGLVLLFEKQRLNKEELQEQSEIPPEQFKRR